MISRTLLRAAVTTSSALAATIVVALSASPAHAANVDDGQEAGDGLSALATLGIFVGIPAALFLVITVLAVAPSMARGPRYRPGLGWWAAPVWFNGPEAADAAVRDAVATPSRESGGASARW
ncbi:MAG: aa3-type cytochrome oxidase subunit CtaJ [Actinomycetes bacterium]